MKINEFIELNPYMEGFEVVEYTYNKDKEGELTGKTTRHPTFHSTLNEALKKVYYILLLRKDSQNLDQLRKDIKETHNEFCRVIKAIENEEYHAIPVLLNDAGETL